jgi:DNA-binding transcriptional ArsR family regulator
MARAKAPELFPLFRSRTQGELLAYVLMSPVRERTAGDIAAAIGAPLSTISVELDRLVRAGVLRERRLGRTRLITANPDAPTVGPLTELVLQIFGPRFVIKDEFRGLPGAEEVWIFGSWAARYGGEPGPPTADIDVLVVGRPDRAAMYEAAQRAEVRLGKPVNTTVRGARAWRDEPDSLVEQLREGPLVPIAIHEGKPRDFPPG